MGKRKKEPIEEVINNYIGTITDTIKETSELLEGLLKKNRKN